MEHVCMETVVFAACTQIHTHLHPPPHMFVWRKRQYSCRCLPTAAEVGVLRFR